MKKRLNSIALLTFPLLLAMGCADTHHRDASVSYSPALSAPLTATSDRQDAREYAAPPASTTDTAVPAGASPQDWNLAQEIRSMLTSHRKLGEAQVIAVVHNGVVTLRGGVRNEQERQRLCEEIRGMQGVQRVDDQMDYKNPLGIGAGESKSY
jgi:osmotically-inducible protein OsmY